MRLTFTQLLAGQLLHSTLPHVTTLTRSEAKWRGSGHFLWLREAASIDKDGVPAPENDKRETKKKGQEKCKTTALSWSVLARSWSVSLFRVCVFVSSQNEKQTCLALKSSGEQKRRITGLHRRQSQREEEEEEEEEERA